VMCSVVRELWIPTAAQDHDSAAYIPTHANCRISRMWGQAKIHYSVLNGPSCARMKVIPPHQVLKQHRLGFCWRAAAVGEIIEEGAEHSHASSCCALVPSSCSLTKCSSSSASGSAGVPSKSNSMRYASSAAAAARRHSASATPCIGQQQQGPVSNSGDAAQVDG
jgi:hypothetical protein